MPKSDATTHRVTLEVMRYGKRRIIEGADEVFQGKPTRGAGEILPPDARRGLAKEIERREVHRDQQEDNRQPLPSAIPGDYDGGERGLGRGELDRHFTAPRAGDHQHDAANDRRNPDDGRKRNRVPTVGFRVDRAEIDDGFPVRVGDALIRKGRNAENDQSYSD